MVLDLFLNKKSESNNSIWMEGNFNVLLMWCHFVRDKWKNILHTLMQGDKLPTSSIWLNMMMWIEVQCGITKTSQEPTLYIQ
jgi:hypothetical protein